MKLSGFKRCSNSTDAYPTLSDDTSWLVLFILVACTAYQLITPSGTPSVLSNFSCTMVLSTSCSYLKRNGRNRWRFSFLFFPQLFNHIVQSCKVFKQKFMQTKLFEHFFLYSNNILNNSFEKDFHTYSEYFILFIFKKWIFFWFRSYITPKCIKKFQSYYAGDSFCFFYF